MSAQHSNFRELLAVYKVLQSFGTTLKSKHVQILSDNVTTIAYINRLGGSVQHMSDLMTTIWGYARSLDISLSARHLSGVPNFRADELSHVTSPYEYIINRWTFNQIDHMWEPHTVDRFCSKPCTPIKKVQLPLVDPWTEGVDALAQNNWKHE